jgi:hypothetical protein
MFAGDAVFVLLFVLSGKFFWPFMKLINLVSVSSQVVCFS